MIEKMRLKTKFFIYITIIHVIFLIVTLVVFKYNKALFVICEAILLLSFLFVTGFYNTIFRFFNLLHAGIESINDRDFSLKFLPSGDPEIDRLVEVYNRMIDQLRLERIKTTEKNFFLERLIEASPAATIILGKKNKIQTLNPAALTLFNLSDNSDLPGDIKDLPAPWDTELTGLNEKEAILIQLNGINQFKCYKSYFINRGVKQAFYIIEELTSELVKAERQSYDKIIRMISHEVNNSVGGVNSIIESTVHFLKNQNDPGNDDYIQGLIIAKERNKNLNLFTNRFAQIVHIPPPITTKCDLQEVVNQVLILFRTELVKKGIKIKTKNLSEQTFVNFDCQQLELVIINIIKNAVEAIGNDGEISLIFNDKPLSLIIENTGEPIPATVQKRLFEPFFTAKKGGQGIGLTIIREILTNHGYDFSLVTRRDGITEFKIDFNKKN